MADATSHVGRLGGIKSKGDLPQRHSLTFAFLVFFNMRWSHLISFTLLGFSSITLAAIGPVTDLKIINADIQPDGFTRSYVLSFSTLTIS